MLKLPGILSLENGLEKPAQINNAEPIIETKPVEKVFYSVGRQTNKEMVEEFKNWINQS